MPHPRGAAMMHDCTRCGGDCDGCQRRERPVPALDGQVLAARLLAAADAYSRAGASSGGWHDARRAESEFYAVARELKRLREGGT